MTNKYNSAILYAAESGTSDCAGYTAIQAAPLGHVILVRIELSELSPLDALENAAPREKEIVLNTIPLS